MKRIFVFALVVLFSFVVQAKDVFYSVYYEPQAVQLKDEVYRMLSPKITGTFEWNNRCKAAKQAIAKVLDNCDLEKKGSIQCTTSKLAITGKGIEGDDECMNALLLTAWTHGFDKVLVNAGEHKSFPVSEPANIMMIPYWKALPGNRIIPGLVELNGRLMSYWAFNRAIQKRDDAVLSVILKGLKDQDVLIRLAVLDAVTNLIGPKKAIGYFKEMVADPDASIRLRLVQILSQLKDKDAVELLKRLAQKDKDLSVRVKAAQALVAKGMKQFKSIASLNQLNSSDPKKVIAALNIIQKNPPEGAGDMILKALNNPATEVQLKVISVLTTLKLFNALNKVVKDGDVPVKIRIEAAKTLINQADTSKDVLELLLRNGPDQYKEQSCKKIEEKGEKSLLPVILNVIANHKGKYVKTCLNTVVALGDSKLIKPLLKLADSVSQAYEAAIEIMKKRSLKEVLSATNSTDPRVRDLAVLTLGAIIKGQDHVPADIYRAMKRLLKDSDKKVQLDTVKVLALTNDKKVLQSLLGFFSNSDENFRTVALIAAEKIPSDKSKNMLLQGLSDISDKVKLQAIKGVHKLRIGKAVTTLLTMTGYQNMKIREAVFDALKDLIPKNQIMKYKNTFLQGLIDKDPKIRLICLDALMGTKDSTIVSAVGDKRIDPDPKVRLKAVEFLKAAATSDAVDALQTFATIDSDVRVRIAAIKALVAIDPPGLVDFLRELLKHENDITTKPTKIKKLIQDSLSKILN